MKNLIEELLLKEIKNLNSIFVFPTQTAAELWADRITLISSVKAVAMDRFIAWDRFKGENIRSTHQDKTSIPSALRTIFATNLIGENSKSPFLKYIISPEFKDTAASFTDWISSILPGLKLWKNYFDKNSQNKDLEDEDLLEIYTRYNSFLEKNNLFDPAWETPPFFADSNHYFIIFPEILSDYVEYKEILLSSKDVTILNLPEQNDETLPKGYLFANSLIEIKNVCSYIRKLHDEQNIEWNEIAVNVPDLDSYGPYLEREFSLYEIPHIIKYSKPLTSSKAGYFFNQIMTCHSDDLAYDSLRELLLNNELPWKDKDTINTLLKFGQENHCICSFDYHDEHINVWKNSFKENKVSPQIFKFFNELNYFIKNIVCAESFSKIREIYFTYRDTFFDMEKCSTQTNNILSRCLSELSGLIDLERDFPMCKIENPYSFFVSYISSKEYLSQEQKCGVNIIPYKLGSTAPFKSQIILDSSQNAISIIYKELNFLRDDKRKILLQKEDPNVSSAFIRLYQMNSTEVPAYFTAGIQTFTGYSQLSSYLEEQNLSKCDEESKLFENNTYSEEKSWLLQKESFPKKITEIQKRGMENWLLMKNKSLEENASEGELDFQDFSALKDLIQTKTLSATQLKLFYFCPRIWLFKEKMKLQEKDSAATLVNQFLTGDIYHRILELFFGKLKEKNLRIHLENDELSSEYETYLQESYSTAIQEKAECYLTKELFNTTTEEMYSTIKNAVIAFSKPFNEYWVVGTEIQLAFDNLVGKPDCLLQSPEKEEYILVDFKSSKNGIPEAKNKYYNEEHPENIPDFQIPLYVYLLKNNTNYKSLDVENACFYNIHECCFEYVFGENLISTLHKTRTKPVSTEEFSFTVNKCLELKDKMIESIQNYDFTLNPSIQTFEQCFGCKYKSICRKTFKIRGSK